jgi:Tol biopolymer transport system component
MDLQSRPGSHDVTPRLSYDELTIYFSTNRDGSYVIYSATRSLRTDPFSMPLPLPNLSGWGGVDQAPTVTADGLTMYFESNRVSNYALEKSTRHDLASDWPAPTLVDSISTLGMGTGDGGPFISPDGKVMYFHSTRTGVLDIYRAELSGTELVRLALVQGINTTTYEETRPVVSLDELTIFWASSRPDGGASGDWDIWTARRQSKNAPFDSPINVSELNSSGRDDPGWLSADQCDLYFGRGGVNADTRLYVAHRPLRSNSDGGLF